MDQVTDYFFHRPLVVGKFHTRCFLLDIRELVLIGFQNFKKSFASSFMNLSV